MLPKIYADFHNLDDDNRIRLTTSGTTRDLEKLGIELTEGLALTFYMDDADDQGNPDETRVDGVVYYASQNGYWQAIVDWNTVYHASELANRLRTNGGPSNQAARNG